jgi:DNA-binding PadR family transcriptional regulator
MIKGIRLNEEQTAFLSAINEGRNPSIDRLNRGFDPLLKNGLIEERYPMSDICDGFRLTEKGRETLRRVESI